MRPYMSNVFSPPLSIAMAPYERGRGMRFPYAGTKSATSRGSVMRPVMAEAMATAGLAR